MIFLEMPDWEYVNSHEDDIQLKSEYDRLLSDSEKYALLTVYKNGSIVLFNGNKFKITNVYFITKITDGEDFRACLYVEARYIGE